jgi:hypothetical protein
MPMFGGGQSVGWCYFYSNIASACSSAWVLYFTYIAFVTVIVQQHCIMK